MTPDASVLDLAVKAAEEAWAGGKASPDVYDLHYDCEDCRPKLRKMIEAALLVAGKAR